MERLTRPRRLRWHAILLLVDSPVKSKVIWEEDAVDSYVDMENSMLCNLQGQVKDKDQHQEDKLLFKLPTQVNLQ